METQVWVTGVEVKRAGEGVGSTFDVQISDVNSWVEILWRHVFYPTWRKLFLESDSG